MSPSPTLPRTWGPARPGLPGHRELPPGTSKARRPQRKGNFVRNESPRGGQPSPFLFKPLSLPAGWPGHSLSSLSLSFFPYYKRSQLQPSPRPGQGPAAAAAAWLASCGRQRRPGLASTGRGPRSPRPEPEPQQEAGEGWRGFCQHPSLLPPLGQSLLVRAENEKPGPPPMLATGLGTGELATRAALRGSSRPWRRALCQARPTGVRAWPLCSQPPSHHPWSLCSRWPCPLAWCRPGQRLASA